jgi:hypothetical protein
MLPYWPKISPSIFSSTSKDKDLTKISSLSLSASSAFSAGAA